MSESSAHISPCPYLGLQSDPRTSLAYSSIWNFCYRTKQPSSVTPAHQTTTCLTAAFESCPVYRSDPPVSLPVDLHGSVKSRSRSITSQTRMRIVLLAVLLVFVVVGIYRMGSLTGGPISSAETSPASGDVPLVGSASSSASATDDQIEAVVATVSRVSVTSPVVRLTGTQGVLLPAAQVCGHQLDVPFGGDVKFVLHRVAYGENLTRFAILYRTTEQAIIDINYDLPIPIWADRVVVIPVSVENVSGLPLFVSYQQVPAAISMTDLARKLKSDSTAIQKYNAFDELCTMYSGWLIVPREADLPEE